MGLVTDDLDDDKQQLFLVKIFYCLKSNLPQMPRLVGHRSIFYISIVKIIYKN